MAELNEKGNLVRTLEVTDPRSSGKKIVVWSVPFSTLVMLAYVSYYSVIVFKDDPLFPGIFIATMVFVVVSDMFIFLWYRSLLGRSGHRIAFYENGIEFPDFLWDRMLRRNAFVLRTDIASVQAVFLSGPGSFRVSTANMTFTTKAGRRYRTGDRIKTDILSTSEWLEDSWKIKVENIDLRGRPVAFSLNNSPGFENGPVACPGCGNTFVNELGFCPRCGRTVPRKEGALDQFQRAGQGPQAPSGPRPDQSHHYQQPLSQDRDPAPPQDQYGQSVPPDQYDPRYKGPDVGLEFPIPRAPNQYDDHHYPQATDPSAKNPRVARLLAALGFLGIMGLGHFYMRKFVKGAILLVIGGFFALTSLVSIITILPMSEFSLEARLTTVIIFTAPFLIILIWQMLDAPKPKQPTYADYPPGY